jgi:hypothetical protein
MNPPYLPKELVTDSVICSNNTGQQSLMTMTPNYVLKNYSLKDIMSKSTRIIPYIIIHPN